MRFSSAIDAHLQTGPCLQIRPRQESIYSVMKGALLAIFESTGEYVACE